MTAALPCLIPAVNLQPREAPLSTLSEEGQRMAELESEEIHLFPDCLYRPVSQ